MKYLLSIGFFENYIITVVCNTIMQKLFKLILKQLIKDLRFSLNVFLVFSRRKKHFHYAHNP